MDMWNKTRRAMEITTRVGCRVSCVYCPQGKLGEAYRKRSDVLEMSFDVFRTCVDKIPLEVDIHFTGMGEPWLNPACTDMVLHAHAKGHKIFVSTTLTGMGSSDVDLLRSVPFESFCIHLPCEEGYEKMQIDEHYLMVLEKIVGAGICNLSYRVFGTLPQRIRPLLDAEKNIVYRPPHTRAGNVEIKNRPSPAKKRGVLVCRLDLHHNILLPNGDVVLCCMDWGLRHVLGNLTLSDYESLFQGWEFERIREGQRNESSDILCRSCDVFAYNRLEKLWKVDWVGFYHLVRKKVDRKIGLVGLFLRQKYPGIYFAYKKFHGK